MTTLQHIQRARPHLPSLVSGWFGPRRNGHKRAFIDIRDLPDHIRRDIGIMDGNDPSSRHD